MAMTNIPHAFKDALQGSLCRFSFNVYDALFIIILAATLIVWMRGVDFVFFDEPNRDYFVSHHIVAYREFPMAGPPNGAYGDIFKNSPVYNYFIASLLFFKDDFLFLQAINVILQATGVGLVYLIGKNIFSHGAALLASLLFIMFTSVSGLTRYIWQPHASLPFFLASVFLLLLAYQKRKSVLFFVSIFFLVLAGGMHISVFAIIPVFLIVLFLIAKEQGKGFLSTLSLAVLTLFGSFFLFYFPIAVHQFFSHGSLLLSLIFSPESYVRNFQDFVAHFSVNAAVFFNALTLGYRGWFLFFDVVLMSLAGFVVPLYAYCEKASHKKVFILSALYGSLSMVALASFSPRSFDHWHFFPGLSLTFIMVAGTIFWLFERLPIPRISGMIFVFLIGIVSLVWFKKTYAFLQEPRLSEFRESVAVTQALKTAILNIQEQESFKSSAFFRLNVYDNTRGRLTKRYDAAYLAPLERALGVKMTVIDDRALGGYSYTNSDAYILLVCENFMDYNLCMDAFLNHSSTPYALKNEVYRQPHRAVFVFKKL